MKSGIHPNYKELEVNCSGCSGSPSKHVIMSSHKADSISVEFCANCHTAWTGKRTVSSKGKVEQFNQRYSSFTSTLRDRKSNKESADK